MAMDISAIGYFVPAFSFTLVLIVIYAILNKTKVLGESKPIQWIVAVVLAVIFASVVNVREYVESIIPWFAVLIIGLFFVIFLAVFAFSEKGQDKIVKPWIVWVLIIILALVFIVSGYHNFNVGSSSDYQSLKSWLYDEKIAGSLWLVVFAAVTGFIITREVKK